MFYYFLLVYFIYFLVRSTKIRQDLSFSSWPMQKKKLCTKRIEPNDRLGEISDA